MNFYVISAIIFTIELIIYFSIKNIVGYMGEVHTKQELAKLPKDEYIILNNVILKHKNGRTAQIDHIVISKYGIFVIETKKYNGFVVGDQYKHDWQEYMGKLRFNFYNPVHQNYGHIKILQEKLGFPEKYFKSIVCFSNTSTLKVKSKVDVINNYQLCNTILKYKEKIVEENPKTIMYYILDNNQNTLKDKIKHSQEVKKFKKDYENKIKQRICPKCGGKLLVRQGKYGQFIGCSEYPRCTYTTKLEIKKKKIFLK